MSLKKIDFSNGIRSVEIESNFKDVQRQIDSERISVAGAGISYGLECLLDGFDLKVTEGCLISYEGEEVFVNERDMNIELPILVERTDTVLKVDANNRVYLSEIPYALTRKTTAENVDIKDCGVTISITGMTGDIAKLPIKSISENIVTLAVNNGTSLEGRTVNAVYYCTKKRRDVIYVDNEYKIRKLTGTTSSSPAVIDMDRGDYIYKIGYIEVNGHDLDKEGRKIATCKFVKEYKSIRNVYTDKSNRLYLCGTPFDSIKVIHMLEPKDPTEGTMWYDESTNKLKIWRHTDKYQFVDSVIHISSDPNHPQRFKTVVPYIYGGNQISVYINNKKISPVDFEEASDLLESEKKPGAMSNEFRIKTKLVKDDKITYKIDRYDGYAEWVSINDSSYVVAQERYIWTPEEISYIKEAKEGDGQYFFFHATDMRNMMFVPNKNCLELIIDQAVLNSDQFEEVTLHDAIASDLSDEIKKKLIRYYGYDEHLSISTIHEEYENIGIGFKLNAKLDKGVYMEAIVTQRINANPLTKRFQRSATFSDESTTIYRSYRKLENGDTKTIHPVFTTNIKYRYKEYQLEVYLNGSKLSKDIHYIEGKEGESYLQGTQLNSFTLLPASGIQDNDMVSYRIETTIYSYDHVEGLLAKFDGAITDMQQSVQETVELVDTLKGDVENYTEEVRGHIDTLINIEESLDNRYMKRDQTIDSKNLDSSIYEGTANGIINQVYTISQTNQRIDVTSIFSDKDYVLISNVTTGNTLVRDIDFNIRKDGNTYVLNILTATVLPNHQIYISGIKFNRA